MSFRSAYLAAFAAGAVFVFAAPVSATPIYALRSANACDTCHIEPLGWYNPPDEQRLCTLDCSGCHVDTAGGGMRRPSGVFYGREVLPTWGTRPSESANPRKYLPEGYPDEGRYRLFEGFSGWWPGNVPMEDIEERFGDIDPAPVFDWAYDYRGALYAPLDDGEGRKAAAFPMQADIYVRGRPTEKLVLYTSFGLQGAKRRSLQSGLVEEDTGALDYLTVRELSATYDHLPDNSHIRIGRFKPIYGWNLPDHTAFIRRDLGFDQNRQVFGLGGGYNPQYFFTNGSVFYQGLDGWPGELGDKGYGGVFQAGWRALGWQAGGNVHLLERSNGQREFTGGAFWGASLYPVVYLGELDTRVTSDIVETGQTGSTGLFAYHEVNWLMFRGFSASVAYHWADLDVDLLDDQKHRGILGVQWNPYTALQFDLQYRANYLATDFTEHEMLFIFHSFL
jgi:hypothetical protein